jgi:hypothetical protein
MDADKITRLTPESIRELLAGAVKGEAKLAAGNRKEERWPFPGTVEVWLPESCYGERHILATLHNLSPNGLAMRTRRPVASGTRIELAIHLPTLSAVGDAIVRHCTSAPVGYLVGVEFVFNE